MPKEMPFFLVLLLMVLSRLAYAEAEDPFKDISFEDVEQIVNSQHPADVSQLLSALLPEFMSSYTLVHDSRSIQGASLVNPRAIVYGRTASFILAFNGDPSQAGYRRLEMMQYRDGSNHYELREITFDRRGARISGKNPARCIACHGNVPHPIWQSYSDWPGVFGSADDHSQYNDEEIPFRNFMSEEAKHPRYKYLNARTDISDHWPYRSQVINVDPYGEYHVYRANDRLGRLLGGRGALSARSLVKSSPFFRSRKNAVLYHFLRCDADPAPSPYFSAIDKLFQQRFPARNFPALYENLANVKDPHYQATLKLEKLILDSDVLSWNLDLGFATGGDRFTPDGFAMSIPVDSAYAGYSDIDDLLSVRLLEEMSAENPALKPFFKPITAVENYDGINGESRAINLTKWGIDKLYDSVNRFMDYKLARTSCASIEGDALRELAQ